MSANVPSSLIAGDTWSWTSSFTDYPAGTWTLTFYFQSPCGGFQVTTTAAGNDFAASLAAASSAAQQAGRYKWRARAVNGSSVLTIEEGWTDVEPNPAASKQDLRSPARQMLDAVEATLIGRATNDQLAMALNGRSISRIPLPDLTQWRDRLRSEVEAEEKGANAGNSRKLKSRFGRG